MYEAVEFWLEWAWGSRLGLIPSWKLNDCCVCYSWGFGTCSHTKPAVENVVKVCKCLCKGA